VFPRPGPAPALGFGPPLDRKLPEDLELELVPCRVRRAGTALPGPSSVFPGRGSTAISARGRHPEPLPAWDAAAAAPNPSSGTTLTRRRDSLLTVGRRDTPYCSAVPWHRAMGERPSAPAGDQDDDLEMASSAAADRATTRARCAPVPERAPPAPTGALKPELDGGAVAPCPPIPMPIPTPVPTKRCDKRSLDRPFALRVNRSCPNRPMCPAYPCP